MLLPREEFKTLLELPVANIDITQMYFPLRSATLWLQI